MTSKFNIFSKLLRRKKDLMICIFLTLAFQLVITTITIKLNKDKQLLGQATIINRILQLIFLIFIIFLILKTNLPFFIKQLLFIIFSIFLGLLLSQSLHSLDPTIIETAAISTLVNFIIMFILGLIIVYMGYDIGWMGVYLLIILLIIITINIIRIFSPASTMISKSIAVATIILFSLFIIYDTNNILLKYKGKGDCIKGALDYYLDIINLFISFLNMNN